MYVDKTRALALPLLAEGIEYVRKCATPEEIQEATKLLTEKGFKYGKCEGCGRFWFLERVTYQIRKPRSQTWLTVSKMLCGSCKNPIVKRSETIVLVRMVEC